ncbi:13807_t:CDS:2, partial [Entrophospora sp. SA101]
YKCRTRLGGNVKTGKPVLSAALQRLVLVTLFNEIDQYLDQYKNRTKAASDDQTTTDDKDVEAGVAVTLRNLAEFLPYWEQEDF